MNHPSKYTEHLLKYLKKEEDYPELLAWVDKLPDLDQPDVCREIAKILRERYEQTTDSDCLEKAKLIELGVDQFEEDILDDKLNKALFKMQFDNIKLDNGKLELFLIIAREAIIKSILADPYYHKKLWDLAHKMIAVEKKEGIYNSTNWSAIIKL